MPETLYPTVLRTTAILLAAGASQRMGLPKPLLLVDDLPLVTHLAGVLRSGGVENIIVVTNAALRELIEEATRPALPVQVLLNPDPDAGMLSSIQVGLAVARELTPEALLVCPCDLPLLTPGPVYAILNYWVHVCQHDGAAIVAPVWQGKRGHPTLFGSAWFEDIGALDSRQVGLNALLKRQAAQVHEVVVEETGVVRDADTPEEWQRWMGRRPSVHVAKALDNEEAAMVEDEEYEIPADVEEALQRQDEAMALLDRLRAEEPVPRKKSLVGGGRRDFRRWPTPPGVSVELHNGNRWLDVDCLDMGTGGARLDKLPGWVQGPVPARLKAPGLVSVITLADIMWRDKEGRAGLRFEFMDEEERELWAGALIDALLARHALT